MKKIYEMSVAEMIDELRTFCITRGECTHCELSLTNHLGDIGVGHKPLVCITDRHLLILMVAIARGYLVWDESRLNQRDRKVFDKGSNVPEQPTVPPMPEPVELPEAKVSELSVNVPEDMSVIMISGKKPTSMTVFYDQEGGGD